MPGKKSTAIEAVGATADESKALSNGSPEKGRGSCSKQLLKRKSRST